MYRKPTDKNLILHFSSRHPVPHKKKHCIHTVTALQTQHLHTTQSPQRDCYTQKHLHSKGLPTPTHLTTNQQSTQHTKTVITHKQGQNQTQEQKTHLQNTIPPSSQTYETRNTTYLATNAFRQTAQRTIDSRTTIDNQFHIIFSHQLDNHINTTLEWQRTQRTRRR